MSYLRQTLFCFALFCATAAQAQLAVTVSSPKVVRQKLIVPLDMKNTFSESVESARAALFLTDEQGKMVGQATRWVIGGTKQRPPLEPNKVARYNFVIPGNKPFSTTNLTVKINFSRIVMAGGKLADVIKDVKVQNYGK
jgi:hypothetical protein